MKQIKVFSIAFILVFFYAMEGGAGNKLTETTAMIEPLADACASDMANLCWNIVPGDNRMLACLYSHSEKLSDRCEQSLSEASPKLKQAAAELAYAVEECAEDLNTLCSDVKPGNARFWECLDKNKAKMSPRCNDALKKVEYQ
mgnify:CR=1 FL=1